MLLSSLPGYSATAVGVNSCVRCIFAAITTVFSSAAVDGLGNGIMFTILAVIGILNGGFIIACYLKGTQWRRSFEQKHMPDLYILNNPDLADVSDLGKSEKIEFAKQSEEQDLEKIHTQHSACIAWIICTFTPFPTCKTPLLLLLLYIILLLINRINWCFFCKLYRNKRFLRAHWLLALHIHPSTDRTILYLQCYLPRQISL